MKPPRQPDSAAEPIIHVVDDDAAVRDSVCLLLETEGPNSLSRDCNPTPALEARAAEQGVERVLSKPPPEDDIIAFVAGCMSG